MPGSHAKLTQSRGALEKRGSSDSLSLALSLGISGPRNLERYALLSGSNTNYIF